VHPLLFHFGNIAIPTYGVLTAIGLLAALALLVLQARRLRLRTEKVWNLGLTAILAALIGARLILIATHFQIFRAHPYWILGLATVPGAWVAIGGAAIGVAAATLYALAEGLPLLRTADAAAPAVALAFALNRIGAFCAGLDWGAPTRLPWGVTYRSVVAYLWYQTPRGIALHPVQLYDAATSLAILVLLLLLPHRRDGETAGAWLFLYGACRFFVEFCRGNAEHVLGGALTVAQLLAVLAVLMGGALWLRRDPHPSPVSI
jgi:phosphatidylglycerol:prolipoprotein diacylglycerol transferase